MKTNLVLFIMSMVFSSCIAQKSFDPKTNPVARIEGEKIVLVVDEATLVNSVKAAKKEVLEVKNFRLEKENEFSYLLFEVVTEIKTIPYAIRLNPQTPGSPLLLATGDTNSCDGHCCESCVFTKNSSGEITGCWCQRATATPGCQTEDRCDHSVTSDWGEYLDKRRRKSEDGSQKTAVQINN